MERNDLRLTHTYTVDGWSARDLRAACRDGTLEQLRRGVYAPPGGDEPRGRHRDLARAAAVLRLPGTAISHASAALFHGLPVPASSLAQVHLTRASGSHGRRRAGVHFHHSPLRDDEVVLIDGFRVTALERTIADTLRDERFEWSVAIADAGLARQADAGVLLAYADAGRRRRGNRNLQRALAFADGRAGSPAESMSRVSMLRAGIPTPHLQFEVINADGEWVATSDFAWPEFRLIGEMDGRVKYDAPDRGRTASDVVAREKDREERIRACGWSITRWAWDVAVDHRRLGEQLRQALRSARIGSQARFAA